jgi:hypothetical protein
VILIVAAAYLCSLIPLVYFLRLMTDARKLEERLPKRSRPIGKNTQKEEATPIERDLAVWAAAERRDSTEEISWFS